MAVLKNPKIQQKTLGLDEEEIRLKFFKYLYNGFKIVIFNGINNDYLESVTYWKKKGVEIGENTRMYNVSIDARRPYLVSIGSNCILTNCRLLTHDASMKIALNVTKIGCIKIGNNVFIGTNSIILPNVSIGNNVVIGAGTIVSKNIPDNSVCVGNPMRIICSYDEFKKKHHDNLSVCPTFTDDNEIRNNISLVKDKQGYVIN